MKTRICLLVLAVLSVLVVAGAQPGAQDAEPAPKPKPAFVERAYDFRSLLADRLEHPPSEPWAEICYYGWQDDPQRDYPEHAWMHAYSTLRPDFPDLLHFTALVEEIAQDGELNSIEEAEYSKTSLNVSATEALHTKIAEARQMLLDLLRARIHIELYRLKSVPSEPILTEIPEGALIGRRDIAHGGYALFSDVTRKRLTWSSHQRSFGTVPETDEHYYGEQWGVAGVILHDGRIRLQTWHSALENTGIREIRTRCGNIQLPTGVWDATPGAAIVPNGGGLVLETTGGAFLIRASTSTPIPHRKFEGSQVSLLNPANAVRPGELTGRWLFKATSLADAWRDGLLILPNGEEHRRFLVEYPETQPWQAGADALSFLIAALDIDSYVSASTYEAMLLLKPIPAAEEEDAESVVDAREVVNQLLDEQLRGPRHHVVEASILRVPRTVSIPAGVANGNPTLAEVRTLAAAAGVRSEFSRRVVLAEQQKCDLVRAKIENYLATLDASDLWDVGKSYSTEVKSHCHGVQIRVKITADGKVNVSAVWRHSSELRKFEPDGDLKGEKLERPDWKDVRFQLDREVGDGAAVCGIQPINDTEVAVLIVSRREVK